jgi:putative ABC transport system substrate-binding protein
VYLSSRFSAANRRHHRSHDTNHIRGEHLGRIELIDREQAQAVIVETSATSVRLSGYIINQCMIRDLPAVHPWSFSVRDGALLSYGPAVVENNSGAAKYVARILMGAKVAELPIQEPTEIKLAINMRTARAIRITIPPALLARADEVIE